MARGDYRLSLPRYRVSRLSTAENGDRYTGSSTLLFNLIQDPFRINIFRRFR